MTENNWRIEALEARVHELEMITPTNAVLANEMAGLNRAVEQLAETSKWMLRIMVATPITVATAAIVVVAFQN